MVSYITDISDKKPKFMMVEEKEKGYEAKANKKEKESKRTVCSGR